MEGLKSNSAGKMTAPIDTSEFQLSAAPDDDPEEGPLLEALAEKARGFVQSRPWTPPVQELLLAFGIGGILGLFLARFDRPLGGELEDETELWVVVGDLPSILFDTELTSTPALALKLYCSIAEDWAEAVLTGRDLMEVYPISAAPTPEHAEMLKGRLEFVREKLIPMA
jgi:hypothetical protein